MRFNPPANDCKDITEKTKEDIKFFTSAVEANMNNRQLSVAYSVQIVVTCDGDTVMEMSVCGIHELHIRNTVGHELANCLITISDFGDAKLAERCFAECTSLESVPSRINAENLPADLNGFYSNCKQLNCKLSEWDTHNVTSMEQMFVGCVNFNSDLSMWNVTKVTNLFWMFMGCKSMKYDPMDVWKPHLTAITHTSFDCLATMRYYATDKQMSGYNIE